VSERFAVEPRRRGDKCIAISDARGVFDLEIDYDDADHEQIDFYLDAFVHYLNRWQPTEAFVRPPL